MDLLWEPVVREALRQAWLDSEPSVFGAHEEGGFILRGAEGTLRIVRWLRGEKASIEIPPHPGARYGGGEIIATFHTHPNTGNSYAPEPSDEDIDAVRDDRELKGDKYIGEFVVSRFMIYLVPPSGVWHEVTATREVFEWQP